MTVSLLENSSEKINPKIEYLEYDSRQIQENSIFFAVQGQVTDGHLYIDQALKNGAVAIVSEREAPLNFPQTWIKVPEIRSSMALLADRFYSSPSASMDLIGITGTNGKTTTAFLVNSILEQQGPSILLGTIHTQLGTHQLDSTRTTPEAIDMQKTLTQAFKTGCRKGVAEVSSHALFFRRTYRCHFPVAVFTNLSQDHLDFHPNLEEYFQSKCLLFNIDHNPGLRWAVLNGDDPFSTRIPLPPKVQKIKVGFSENCHIHPITYQTSVEGTKTKLKVFDRELSLNSHLSGKHNLYNIMLAVAATTALEVPDNQICNGISKLTMVPGRFEKVDIEQPFTVIVDYAHTPQALQNVLELCHQISSGRVICVFGCGGERDRTKRPLMGNIAVQGSDLAIITSDNPRWENPQKIIQNIQSGIPSNAQNYEVIVDRRQAITRSLELVQPEDIVLIAGKGHEIYQEIKGEKLPFDDREVVKENQ